MNANDFDGGTIDAECEGVLSQKVSRRGLLNIDAEARAITRAMKKIQAKSRAAGIEAMIFFESEGGIYVLDRTHPGYHAKYSKDRQSAIVGEASIQCTHDVGAW